MKLSYTITHDGLTFSSKKKKICATSISVRVASLRPHTALDLKQTVLKWIKVVGECKATFISKS